MNLKRTLLATSLLSTLGLFSTATTAAGFQLAEYSATGLGRAYAGEAAMADNASAQWRNPAMLTYLKGTQVSVGAIYVDPNIDINGEVKQYWNGESEQANAHDFADSAVIPNFYISHQINEQLFAGFAAGTNYGMETNLGKDFTASHFGNEAAVTTMELNANLGYQINERLSIGGGLRYIIAEGHFGATAPTENVIGIPAGTPLKYMEGDTTDWGWQLGAAWQINDSNRLGIAYKSEVNLKLEGDAKIFDPESKSVLTDTGSMELPLPATLEIASFHQLSNDWAIHASFNWTNWSSFEKLEANLDTYGTTTVKDENWKDNYRFAVGATYQLNEKLVLRTGAAYDTSAVSDDYRTITIPETDRTWLSFGASYDFTSQFTLDGGFTYIFAKDADVNEPREGTSDWESALIGGSFSGTTTGNVWLLGVQANYTF
ncbi:outer membrane protein transport protein [Vibrio agarivorans]|uniref:outer membrane protein transport protein n=1 Tax=Vibrio agarivorans TaxID=153622 RepID=UPI0025B3936A|nr:outer membrane protein transport protein [Vibrio agarivorans]MDN3662878.1 outer membrane protein transport protein [Vibrio agarivorans]